MVSQAAEKLPDDVIPKPGAFCRAEESALFSAERDKSRFLAPLGMTAKSSFSSNLLELFERGGEKEERWDDARTNFALSVSHWVW